jgi:choice-of-anchor B domain-containing protein
MEKIKYTLITLAVLFLSANLFYSQEQLQNLNVNLLGNIDPYPNSRYSDVWGFTHSDGREYALLGVFDGVSIIDVTNSATPVEIDFIEGPNSIWRDIKVKGNYAYSVTEGRGTNQGLQIIDLSDLPNSVSLITANADFFITSHNVFVSDSLLFACGTNSVSGVLIFDISDPEDPQLLSSYTESGYVHDLYAWDNRMIVCAGDHYAIVDIEDAGNPELISSSPELPGIYAHSGWMTEDKKYFFSTDEFNENDISVWDLSDETSWDLVIQSWQMPTSSVVHNLFIKDDYAHISYYGDGYVVLDISDPEAPELVGQYDTDPNNVSGYRGAWGCYPYFETGKVLISDINNGLFILDFLKDGSVTSLNNKSINKPLGYELYANYPNPFNPSTQISYSLAENGNVMLTVYNVLGERVDVLVNDVQSAGTHSVNFNASNLSGGIYFLVMESADFIKTIKMTLIK